MEPSGQPQLHTEAVMARLREALALGRPWFPVLLEAMGAGACVLVNDTPADIEARVGASGGSMHHLDMTLDQLFSFRPLPELSRYRTPIAGLYLTGAGTHPGGGITCAPGHNTAQEVISDLGLG